MAAKHLPKTGERMVMGSTRILLSDAVKRVIHRSGLLGLSRRYRRTNTALILRYHSVGSADGSAPIHIDPSLCVPAPAFAQQMRFIRDHYTPVSLDQLFEAIKEERPFPQGAVAITFDDGYRDNYSQALPILKEYGLPATFYITAGCVEARDILWTSKLRYYFMATRERELHLRHPTSQVLDLSSHVARQASYAHTVALIKSVGRQRGGDEVFQEVEAALKVTNLDPLADSMLSWEEIREMGQAGMLIGAHTLTHPNLPGLPPEAAEAEVAGSKALIEERVKVPVDHFAYPNGRGVSHFNDTVKEIVRRAGFLTSVTSISGPICHADDLFTLRRLGVYRKHAHLFRFALDMERTRLSQPSSHRDGQG
jgi:peptidoglycan/xylan/chitin deacetylase (PgdA/CDA1 family)